jgi:hypothetical protein
VNLAQVNKVWAKAVIHEKVTSVLDVSSSSTITTRVGKGSHLILLYFLFYFSSIYSNIPDIAKALPHILGRYAKSLGLRVLVLKGCYSLKEEHLESMSYFFFFFFFLIHMLLLNYTEILQLGTNTLENINLEECVALRSLSVLQDKSFLANLRTLNLSRCRSVSTFPSIQCPQLHTLQVSQCDGLLGVNILFISGFLKIYF